MTELIVPTPSDFPDVARLKATAFADKCATSDGGRTYRKYERNHTHKVGHCRIVKEGDLVIGAIQLQMGDDPGDPDMPFPHKLKDGESYIEFISTHPDHRGKGVGLTLLQWAEEFSQRNDCKFMSLDVMKANTGAIRLYERKGFVVSERPKHGAEGLCCGHLPTCVNTLVLCMVSCGKYIRGVHFMTKPLRSES